MALRYRTCPFCEATCGLEIETEGREVISVAHCHRPRSDWFDADGRPVLKNDHFDARELLIPEGQMG